MLQEERNPLIEEQLLNLKYTKEAIDTLKANINRIRKVLQANCYAEAWRRLLLNRDQKSRMSLMIKSRNLPNSVYSKAYRAVQTGDILTKINYKNGQKSSRFFRVFMDNSLRWSQRDKDLTNPKIYRSCKIIKFLIN